MTVKFRASSVGNLMIGGNAITDKQLEKLKDLEARRDDPNQKPLTPKMQSDLDELIEKRDAEFTFGASAKKYIRACWRYHNYGYRPAIMTNQIIKGLMCEEEAIDVLTRQVEGGFRCKNEQQFENDWFMGCPDCISDEWVEDVKCSWNLETFQETEKPDPIYYAQGQAYMDLTGLTRFRLAHCLIDTPEEIVAEERKRFFFRFSCDEDSPYYQECVRDVDSTHYASRMVPEEDRIKTFVIERHEGYLATLRQRVEQARVYYDTITL